MWPFKKKKDDYFGRLVVGKKSLGKPCLPVGDTVKEADKAEQIAEDLIDAARFFETRHKLSCCGLAANQLGYKIRVIVVRRGRAWIPYINPHFTATTGPDNRQVKKIEGCLSHPNTPFKVKRYRKIMAWGDNQKPKLLTGLEAEAFQHEIDHLNGVLI